MAADGGLGELSAQSLLGLAGAHRFKVTAGQLARWHRAGILPTPMQRSLGRGRGSETIYPPGTDALLLAICEARKHKRKLDHVAWTLWWNGHDVPMEPVRSFMRKTAVKVDRTISGATPLPAIAKMKHGRLSKPISGIRKRVGREQFPELLNYMLGILSNEPDNPAQIDSSTLAKALGLQRAQKDHIIGAGPLITSDITDTFNQIGPLLGSMSLLERLDATSNEDLRKSRDDFQALVSIFSAAQQQSEKLWGRGMFGLSSINQWFKQSAPQVQALTVLSWTVLTAQPVFAEGWNKILETKPNLDAAKHNSGVMESFRAQFPSAANILTDERLGVALRSKKKRDQLKASLRRFRKKNRKQLDAFFEKHKLSP
jgi:hypothetical protein